MLMSQNKIKLEREKLYEEIWSEPVSILAVRYGLSDVGLAKTCRRLNIPLPGRGYWAKIRAGQIVEKIPLPPLPEGSSSYIEVSLLSVQEVSEKIATQGRVKEQAVAIEKINVDEVLTNPHPLIKAAQKRLSIKSGWVDVRGVRKAPTEVLDIAVTADSLDRALRLADALIKQLTSRGVSISIDSSLGKTELILDEIKISFSLSEHVKRTDHVITPEETKARERRAKSARWEPYQSIPRYDYYPTGLLTITVGHWPSKNCKDTINTGLEERLGEVVQNVFEVARLVKEQEIERARQVEIRRLAVERYNLALKRLEDEKVALSRLESDANNFARSRQLRDYVLVVEKHSLATGSMTSELEAWVAWAKLKADWLNPINKISDLILDAPLPKKPGYW